MELKKPWNDGGSLTVAYEGSGDGSAVFSSDAYEGIDREQSVVFRDAGGTVAVERNVRQEGIRQPIGLADGGVFRLANGGRFGVLKEKQKTVNQIRLSILPPTFSDICKVVNSDDQSATYKFDYDVTSTVDVMIRMRVDGEEDENVFLHFTTDKPILYGPQKLISAGFVSMRCEPAEDENYIYEVIVTDLRS